MGDIINAVDITQCSDESVLEQLLDELDLDHIDERKRVRARLQGLKQAARAVNAVRMDKYSNSREESIQRRQQEAIEGKRRTLEMYDQMAKSSPAGGYKVMNVNILRGESVDSNASSMDSSASGSGRRDLVEEAIQDRKRANDEEKHRILAAYDSAAKSGPAGTYRVADLKNFTKQDAASFKPEGKPAPSCCFGSSGGIPIVSKVVIPQKGSSPGKAAAVIDLGSSQEKMIRDRQQQMMDNKARILAAYDDAAKQGAGPKTVMISDLPDAGWTGSSVIPSSGTTSCTVSFSGGMAINRSLPGPSLPSSPSIHSASFSTAPLLTPSSALPLAPTPSPSPSPSPSSTPTPSAAAAATISMSSPVMVMQAQHTIRSSTSVSSSSSSSTSMSSSSQSIQQTSGVRSVVGASVMRSPSDLKDMLLRWARHRTRGYENVDINNFSSSWSDGLAFCALIHSYFSDAFDYNELDKKNRKHNFTLAFAIAEQRADICPLLDVEDMIMMRDKPDWRCVFTYVQSMYRSLRQLE